MTAVGRTSLGRLSLAEALFFGASRITPGLRVYTDTATGRFTKAGSQGRSLLLDPATDVLGAPDGHAL